MAQKFDYPETENQLCEILDKLYQHSKEVHDSGGRPAFKGLIEIMSAEATIIVYLVRSEDLKREMAVVLQKIIEEDSE